VTGPRLAVTFWKRAARQVESAADWWHENRHDSPDALSDELARTLELITLQPGVGLPAVNARPGVRRILLPRVGYFLFYRVAPRKQLVEVTGLLARKARIRPRPLRA
jgi:plasmid stabilization system protein ParE